MDDKSLLKNRRYWHSNPGVMLLHPDSGGVTGSSRVVGSAGLLRLCLVACIGSFCGYFAVRIVA